MKDHGYILDFYRSVVNGPAPGAMLQIEWKKDDVEPRPQSRTGSQLDSQLEAVPHHGPLFAAPQSKRSDGDEDARDENGLLYLRH